MIVLETERLILSEQTETDAAFVLELMNTDGWLTYIGDRGVRTVEDAAAYIRNGAMKSYTESGFGFYLVTLKETNMPIGISGLVKRPALDHADIGFAFLPQHEGRGYGYESASAVLDYAASTLNIDQISAITVKENTSSINLLQKLGLHFSKIITLPGSNEELMLFERRL